MSFAPDTETFAKPQALLRVPVGMASPLWGLFAGAAMTGATWWWMTRWTRPQNLEAMFGATAEAEAVIEPETVALSAPVIEAIVETAPEPRIEATEPIVEAAIEAAPEPVAEVAPAATMEPVVEAAPEPIVEAAPAPAVLEAAEPEAGEPLTTMDAAGEPALTPRLKKRTATPPATDTSA